VAGRPIPALHASKDGTHRLPADLGRELFDRCQRDLLKARNGGVVVASHRYVAGNLHVQLSERVEYSEGTQIITDEDRGYAGGIREELAGRVVSAALGERCVHDARLAREPVSVHSGLVALDSLGARMLGDIGGGTR
jgi:hypothetical protein